MVPNESLKVEVVLPLRAKTLGPPLLAGVPDLVPARMVNEVLYCERLMVLEWAQGEFADNAFTVEGRVVHERADTPKGSLPEPPAELPFQVRSLWISSERLGATAKIDIVEGEGGLVTPIEYKRGEAPDLAEGAYLPERAQIALQVMLLRDQGHRCDEGAIWFAASRRRVPIAVDAALEETVRQAIARARELAAAGHLPPPLTASPKCDGCSLAGICLPDEVHLLKAVSADEAPTEAPGAAAEVRRLVPARDDRVPLYVQEQGARVSLDGEVLVAAGRKQGRVESRLPNTSQVCVLGNVQVTTQAVRALLERGIPLVYFTYGGYYLGRSTGTDSKNVDLRLAQFRAATDSATCLRLARGFVVAKIKNQRTMLRRNHEGDIEVALGQLDQLARKAAQAESLGELLGLEGSAARVYFERFSGMLRPADGSAGRFDFDGRNRRPPRDPVNALLSFVYALLVKDLALACHAVGLDPLLGFYHQPRFGRPALALDLMEEMRPIVAESTVISLINMAVVDRADFLETGTGVAIKPAARRKVLLAYERRMDSLVTHPVFDYRISYRRVLEVQARLLSRVLLGELDTLPAFRTR